MNKDIKTQIAQKALLHSNAYDSSFCDSLEFLYPNLTNTELLEITLEAQELVINGEIS